MKKFCLIGAAGYIAPRHLKAIKDVGGELIAAMDVNDSVGILDGYFPNAKFFSSFELLDAYVNSELPKQARPDYVSVASPNFLHFAHIQWALRSGAQVICEKPLVIDPSHIDTLARVERESGQSIYSVLQLRHHPVVQNLRKGLAGLPSGKKVDVDLMYVTSRGQWYQQSWKARDQESGGILFNIGIHFFDMLHFVFGDLLNDEVHLRSEARSAGYLEYQFANVRWFLSLDAADLPREAREAGSRTHRAIIVDGVAQEFSEGFTDLHASVYQAVMAGRGDGLNQARHAIEVVHGIKTASVVSPTSCDQRVHPQLCMGL